MKQPSKKIDWSIVEDDNEWQARLQGAPVETCREAGPTGKAALRKELALETLIPALFGVSRAEFETGWQAYLAKRYD